MSEKEVGIAFNPSYSKGLIIKFFLGVAITNSLLYGNNFRGNGRICMNPFLLYNIISIFYFTKINWTKKIFDLFLR